MAETLMNIGTKGDPQLVIKRKFRWILQMDGSDVWYAKSAARPTLTVEETEVHHLHERWMISGKPTWETITVTVLDCKGGSASSEDALHKWLNSVFAFDDEPPSGYAQFDMGDHDAEYKKDLVLKLLGGHGQVMEIWNLHNCWPQSSNFGDLDYSSSDTADVEMTIRFDRATWSRGE